MIHKWDPNSATILSQSGYENNSHESVTSYSPDLLK